MFRIEAENSNFPEGVELVRLDAQYREDRTSGHFVLGPLPRIVKTDNNIWLIGLRARLDFTSPAICSIRTVGTQNFIGWDNIPIGDEVTIGNIKLISV